MSKSGWIGKSVTVSRGFLEQWSGTRFSLVREGPSCRVEQRLPVVVTTGTPSEESAAEIRTRLADKVRQFSPSREFGGSGV